MQDSQRCENILNQLTCVAHGDEFLPLSLRQGAGDLVGEVGGSDQIMDLRPVVVAQPKSVRG